ncbi:hypothetical protein [Dongshaea marina]|uniref:hypothetical protein n=1 Tax=Dongshaea marina TaxID=2047966 RepID=UPI000D3E6E87|nr:hypothetical protein [Dongshaea marina]
MVNFQNGSEHSFGTMGQSSAIDISLGSAELELFIRLCGHGPDFGYLPALVNEVSQSIGLENTELLLQRVAFISAFYRRWRLAGETRVRASELQLAGYELEEDPRFVRSFRQALMAAQAEPA